MSGDWPVTGGVATGVWSKSNLYIQQDLLFIIEKNSDEVESFIFSKKLQRAHDSVRMIKKRAKMLREARSLK